jgi:hypothetical protein
MIEERIINPTSSVGAAWPPEIASNNRMRGFYDSVVKTSADIETFASHFNRYQAEVADHPEIDRLSIRAVVSVGAIATIDCFGINLEGAMPIRGNDELMIVYTAWNDTSRRASEEKLSKHRDFLSITAEKDRDMTDRTAHLLAQGFMPKVIDQFTPRDQKQSMTGRFADLYSAFGYTESEVKELLLNPVNMIAYIEDDQGVVSTAMAERAVIAIKGHGDIKMAEITEAFTLPSHRERGLYQSISGYLINRLVKENSGPLDVIYGESNLAMPGVVIAAHKNGRCFSYLDREELGVSRPNFGILQQNFHVQDGEESRRFNDFALSYVPLG